MKMMCLTFNLSNPLFYLFFMEMLCPTFQILSLSFSFPVFQLFQSNRVSAHLLNVKKLNFNVGLLFRNFLFDANNCFQIFSSLMMMTLINF